MLVLFIVMMIDIRISEIEGNSLFNYKYYNLLTLYFCIVIILLIFIFWYAQIYFEDLLNLIFLEDYASFYGEIIEFDINMIFYLNNFSFTIYYYNNSIDDNTYIYNSFLGNELKDIEIFGLEIFENRIFDLLISGLILFIAMITSIVLVLTKKKKYLNQNLFYQQFKYIFLFKNE
jgi:NADH:ubiquinone oxidoreductase subunit 6 (subunit J)